MMPDRAVAKLTLAHDYDPFSPPAVRVIASANTAIRRRGASILLIVENQHDNSGTVGLTLLSETVDFCLITKGYDWVAVPVLAFPAGTDRLLFDAAQVLRTDPRRIGDRRIAQLEIAVEQGATRDIRLDFEAISAHWTYHLTGRGLRDDLEIVDADDTVGFDDLGARTLPDGTTARVIRSTVPLALRARPLQRFVLQHDGRFGPTVLIPALPAAGTKIRPITEDGAPGRLQSDIYVTL